MTLQGTLPLSFPPQRNPSPRWLTPALPRAISPCGCVDPIPRPRRHRHRHRHRHRRRTWRMGPRRRRPVTPRLPRPGRANGTLFRSRKRLRSHRTQLAIPHQRRQQQQHQVQEQGCTRWSWRQDWRGRAVMKCAMRGKCHASDEGSGTQTYASP